MTIGIPRALLYYKHQHLWQTFFELLGFQVVLSEHTNRRILEDGIRYSIDECCLPAKIYMGHVYSLIDKCDLIFVPRVVNFGRNETVCVKFHALYDIVKNTFPSASLLDCNIDVENGESELKGFLQVGKRVGASYPQTLSAYQKAKRVQVLHDRMIAQAQAQALDAPNELKILLVGHPYNVYDKLLGATVIQQIQQLGGDVIFADAADSQVCIQKSRELSDHLYWTYNKELIGAISLYQDRIDGIVLLTAFPCGPDSLVNELIFRKIKKPPIINIILDELQGEAGLQTRIESFIDIIRDKKKEAKKAGALSHG